MKPKLKPCPFCGNSPEQTQVYVINDVKITRHEIYCASCYIVSFKGYDEAELIKRWNNRHDEMTIKKTLLLIVNIAVYSVVLAIVAALAWNFYQSFQ